MPTYAYRCPDCGEFDIQQSIHDDPLTACGTCDAPIQRIYTAPTITFRGGREFFSSTTIRTEQEKARKAIRDSGGTPEPIGNRWV